MLKERQKKIFTNSMGILLSLVRGFDVVLKDRKEKLKNTENIYF